VQQASSWAGLGLWGLKLLFVAGIWLAIAYRDPALAWELLHLLWRLLVTLIDGLITLLHLLRALLIDLAILSSA
jgi:hypothetical protein